MDVNSILLLLIIAMLGVILIFVAMIAGRMR